MKTGTLKEALKKHWISYLALFLFTWSSMNYRYCPIPVAIFFLALFLLSLWRESKTGKM